MTDTIVITLRGEPTAVGRPRFSRAAGVAYTPTKTRHTLAAMRLAGQQVMADRPPLEGPLNLDFRAELRVPSSWSKRKQNQAVLGNIKPTVRPDWENLAKLVDGLNGVVWRDDSQIVRATVIKVYSLVPGITVTVTPILGIRMLVDKI